MKLNIFAPAYFNGLFSFQNKQKVLKHVSFFGFI